MKTLSPAVENTAINAIRVLSAEAIQKANSGHPGLPMGAAPMAWTLFSRVMKHNPADPNWPDRDRFVLSAGHGSMLLYSLLHLFGYGGLTTQDLSQFRQWGSKTPGHPEFGHTVGVETTTGPLGQGFASAVGMAMAETRLAAHFNRPGHEIVDHHTYCIMGDGCMMEGISYEAASLAGTWGLGKLIALYDSNNISIEGNTDIAFRENVGARFEALGWQVLTVSDGNDTDAIDKAIQKAKACTDKPTMIEIKTVIGFGCPDRQGKASAHGEPLGEANLAATKENLGWKHDPFTVPQEVYDATAQITAENAKVQSAWQTKMQAYVSAYPDLSKEWELWMQGKSPVSLFDDDGYWAFEGSQATRNLSGDILNKIADHSPNLVGGAADLAPSTKTYLKGKGDYSKECRDASNLHFGVRELAMAGICNGIAVHGGLRAFCATFFVFSDYIKPVVRLASIMKLPVLYVLTHDSIGVGEDGPTHQPIEQLASLRSIPGMTVFRPADGKETAAAYAFAIQHQGPVALALTRQNLPTLSGSGKQAMKGGYILQDCQGTPDLILIATGSEVQLAVSAANTLTEQGKKVRVVSMPSLEVFDAQSDSYKEGVLPKAVRKRVAIEALSDFGWHKYVGLDGEIVAMRSFGACGPANTCFTNFGFTAENLLAACQRVLG